MLTCLCSRGGGSKRDTVTEEVPLDKDLKKWVGWGTGTNKKQCEWKQWSHCLACGCLDQQTVSGAGTKGRGGGRRGKGHERWFACLSSLDILWRMLTFSLLILQSDLCRPWGAGSVLTCSLRTLTYPLRFLQSLWSPADNKEGDNKWVPRLQTSLSWKASLSQNGSST